jgi:hypothetical protein
VTPARAGRHKYGARRTRYGGVWYASAAEAARAAQLDRLKRAGAIKDWWPRPAPLVLVDGARRRDRVTYQADFCVVPLEGPPWLEDVKGVLTPVFRLKAKLLRARYPGLVLRVLAADGHEVRL